MALFSVLFDIAAKTADFESSMARVERKFTSLADTAKQAAQLIGGYFAAEKLFSSLDEALDRAVGLKHFAEAAGIATDALSKLEFAAKQTGLGTDQLETGLKKFNVAINSAAHGGGVASEAFKALGISVLDANGHTKDADTLLKQVAQRFSETQDGSGKTAVAVALFGRAGQLLIPMLDKGASGLKEFGDQAQRAGLITSEQTAEAAVKLHEQLGVLEAGIKQGLTDAIISNLLPSMTAFAKSFDNSKASIASADELVEQISDGVRFLASVVLTTGDTFEALGKSIAATLAQANAAIHGNFSQIKTIQTEFDTDMLAQEAQYQKRLKAIWTTGDADILQEITLSSKKWKAAIHFGGDGDKKTIAALIRQQEDALKERVENLKQTLIQMDGLWREANDASIARQYAYWMRLNEDSKKLALDHLHQTIANNQMLMDEVKKMYDYNVEAATSAAKNMQSALETFFYDPAKEGLRGLLTAFIDTVRQMVAQVAAAKLMQALFGQPAGGGQAGTSFFGSILSAIFGGGKAAGGPVQSGTTYLVGERGPELFTPGASGAITPNIVAAGGQGGDVITITINSPVDARGAQEGQAQQIAKAMAASNESVKQDIIEGLRRRKYRI